MESDVFLARYPSDFLPTAIKYMAETAKYPAEKLGALLDRKSQKTFDAKKEIHRLRRGLNGGFS